MEEKTARQQEFFINRLLKNEKQLRKWAAGNNYESLRLYDRDIPEVPLIVERHKNTLLIWDRRSFTDSDAGERAAWLTAMTEAAAEALHIRPELLFVKERQRQKGNSQYGKVSARQKEIVVNEGPLKFIINLTDYLDTGLFLDHRHTRERIMEESKGKNVLNLFAYTGSFSLYARQGGAESTTTLDLSQNYLEWAKRNFEQNNLMTNRDHFLREDILRYLPEAAKSRTQFDIIVLDPPTFSNSAKMENTLDTQRDQAALIGGCLRLLSPKGILYFSTNNRKFSLDMSFPEETEVREITNETIPRDFRDKKIHRCWRIVKETV